MPMPRRAAALLLPNLLFVSATLAGAPTPPRADGLFDDWQGVAPIATDPAGDQLGVFDITSVSVQSFGTTLFVRFDTTAVRNLQAGLFIDGTLGMDINVPSGDVLNVNFRARNALLNGNFFGNVSWTDLRFNCQPTFAASEFEVRIDLAAVGVFLGDTITFNFSGADSLDEDITWQFALPEPEPTRRSMDRVAPNTIRIASQNTLFNGLLDNSPEFPRRDALLRLIDAVDADVYCFQEEWNNTSTFIDTLLEQTDPLEDGAFWRVHKNNGTVICAPAAIYALDLYNSRYDALVVDFRDERGAIIVFSIHPKCCGYIGSGEDAQRIDETEEMIQTLQGLRDGLEGEFFEQYRDAPVVVMGDWNLVGSRTPLDMWLDAEGPDLTHVFIPQLVGEDVTTWRDFDADPGTFAPGLLDLVAFQDGPLRFEKGFIPDTTKMDSGELAMYGLQADDSLASDHLMVVAEFARVKSGDLNGDGQISAVDLAVLLGRWGMDDFEADMDLDGVVGAGDIALLISNWGPAPF